MDTDSESQDQEQSVEYYPFMVGERPFCVWDWDLAEKNREFIASLDPGYFAYLAASMGPDLDTDHKLLAGAAIRSAYGLGLETLFAVLFASLQAPACLAGWLHKYQMSDLRGLVEGAGVDRHFLTYAPVTRFTFDDITTTVLSPLILDDKARESEVKKGFALALRRLASDFLDPKRCDEYNDLKHGLRTAPGGFRLSVGTEHEYGVPPPASEMRSLGGSTWGSRSLAPQGFAGKRAHHFWLQNQQLNWVPANHLDGLQLISLWLENILAFLRIELGERAEATQFRWPSDVQVFHAPWSRSCGVNSSSFDTPVPPEAIRDLSKEQIREECSRRTAPPEDSF